jgi:hypothetical protein
MKNLNVPGQHASSAFLIGLAALGCNPVLVDNSIHVEGTAEQEAAAEAFAATFDLAAGLFADKARGYEKAVQAHLDAGAQAAGYDNVLSACSYAGYANPFQVEGQSFTAWRGTVWEYCYTQLALVQAGTRTEPTVDELIAELPVRA